MIYLFFFYPSDSMRQSVTQRNDNTITLQKWYVGFAYINRKSAGGGKGHRLPILH